MVGCEVCGKDVNMPFKCAYCGSYFCAEHRIPESQNCQNKPSVPPIYISAPRFAKDQPVKEPEPEHYQESRKKSVKKKALVAIPLLIVLVASVILLASLNNPSFNSNSSSSNSNSSSSNPNPTTISTDDLVNYALSLINTDRQANGLQNVTLGSIDSGQLHANDMLAKGYFSHWDMNGYKPYMRNTLAGGKGAVDENIAWQGKTGYIVGIDVESALKDLEYAMMYNDAAENWGHRDNILNPLHNGVSIGIAYDNNNVYFVEDFINDYISWNQLSVNGNKVTMQGTIQNQISNVQQIAIYYDNPSQLAINQLNNPPYQDGYDPGTNAATVLPPNWQATSGITITADNWNQNGNSFQISFSLSLVIAVYGNGVYTLYLYLETANSTADSLTTYSLFIE